MVVLPQSGLRGVLMCGLRIDTRFAVTPVQDVDLPFTYDTIELESSLMLTSAPVTLKEKLISPVVCLVCR